MLSAWLFNVLAMLVPRRSDWTSAATNSETSCTSQRWARFLSAVRRTMPMRTSSWKWRHSSMSGPCMRPMIFRSELSNERPACTLTQSRSSISGSCAWMACWRFDAMIFVTEMGA